jgi:putative permease
MLNIVRNWVDRYFSDEEAVVLFVLLLAGLLFVLFWGDVMAPAIASVIVAFVLQGLVAYMHGKGVPKGLSVYLSFFLFIGGVLAFMFWLLPLVWRQLSALIKDAPQIFSNLKHYLYGLHEQYPAVLSIDVIDRLYQQATDEMATLGQWLVSQSLASVPVLITVLIYFVVVPLLVFFFLKDKDRILNGIATLLPTNRSMLTRVWVEMNMQFANYVRGKVVEILVVGIATYMGFVLMGLNYSLLLAILVGLSVVIPYIGAVVVTIPVTLIALFQFGLTDDFYYLMLVYLVIQGLDGNVLVPCCFLVASGACGACSLRSRWRHWSRLCSTLGRGGIQGRLHFHRLDQSAFAQCGQDFGHMAVDLDLAPSLDQFALDIKQKGTAFDAHVFLAVEFLQLNHIEQATQGFVRVAAQFKRKFVFLPEVFMTAQRVF